jgi:PAS domain S-box-containing protein
MLKTLKNINYYKELITLLFEGRGGAFAVHIIAPLLISFILKEFVPNVLLLIWLLTQIILFFIRFVLAKKGLEALEASDDDSIRSLLKYYLLIILLNAVLLAMAILMAMIYASESQVFEIAGLLAGLIAGSMATLSPVFHAVFIFVAASLITITFSAVFVDYNSNYYLLSILSIIYMAVVIPASFNIYSTLSKALRQQGKLEEKNRNFQDLLDSTLEMIVIYDKKFRVIAINQAGIELLKLENKDSTIGRVITDFIPEYELQKIEKSLQNPITEAYELDLKKDDGTIFPTLTQGRDILLEGKHVRLGTILDLTQIKQKEQLLFQQSKSAAMGEMISNIAHQWRQPLNALSLTIQNIYYSYESNQLDIKQLKHSTDKAEKLMLSMSQTIDDFRDFFKPNKIHEEFNISSTINKTIDLISASYKNSNIVLTKTLEEKLITHGHSNEFSQVLLNILNNSKDAIQANNIFNPNVSITSYHNNDAAIIEIEDNAGGINPNIINKIFEPYFTTKAQDIGTGIGLYMSKMIIEKSMHGKIDVSNTKQGTKFTITLPT